VENSLEKLFPFFEERLIEEASKKLNKTHIRRREM